jgi:hypothetical protein
VTDELVQPAVARDLLIVFDLEPRDPGRDAANLHAAYVALAELGFLRVVQNILLPAKTVMGPWFGAEGVDGIRNTIASYLVRADLPVQRLIVCEFNYCAWIGTPLL